MLSPIRLYHVEGPRAPQSPHHRMGHTGCAFASPHIGMISAKGHGAPQSPM